jgi:hypothetical protein
MFRFMIIPVAVGLAVYVLFARPTPRTRDDLSPGALNPTEG